MRLYTVPLSAPGSGENRKIGTLVESGRAAERLVRVGVERPRCRRRGAWSAARRGTARRTTPPGPAGRCPRRSPPAGAARRRPPRGSATGSPNVGPQLRHPDEAQLVALPRRATQASDRRRARSVSESTGGATIPARASANAVPIVGCPAIGSSSAGVKIRTRASVSGRSGGSTNVVSEKFISFAIACIVALESPRPSSTTASWLPPNRSIGEDVEMECTGKISCNSSGEHTNVERAFHDERGQLHGPAVRRGRAEHRRQFRRAGGRDEGVDRSEERPEGEAALLRRPDRFTASSTAS